MAQRRTKKTDVPQVDIGAEIFASLRGQFCQAKVRLPLPFRPLFRPKMPQSFVLVVQGGSICPILSNDFCFSYIFIFKTPIQKDFFML